MSWLQIPFRRGVLKIKPRWQMRTAEREREVWVMDLGLVLVSYWDDKARLTYDHAGRHKLSDPTKPKH